MKAAVIAFLCLAALGCVRKDAVSPPTGVGGSIAEIGDYSVDEVQRLRSAIAEVKFPVPEGTIVRLLPRPVKPLPVLYADAFGQDARGRRGGNIVEYWLNDDRVLKVAIVYYAEGERHFSLEEWAVILSRRDRDSDSRPIYR